MHNFSNSKDLQNAIGFTQHYGFSPQINLKTSTSSQKPLKYSLFGTKDIRHIYKTINNCENEREKIEFHLYEKNINNILRNILLYKIVIDKELTLREKIESYLDLYYNQLIIQKTFEITKKFIKEIQDEIINEKKSEIFDFKNLKYRQRDDLVTKLDLWLKLVKDLKFLKENCLEFTDRRKRYLYKERYDYRKNLIDADFVWGINNLKISKKGIVAENEKEEENNKIEKDENLEKENISKNLKNLQKNKKEEENNKIEKDNNLEKENISKNLKSLQKNKNISKNLDSKIKLNPVLRKWEYINFRSKGIAYAIHSNEENHRIFNFTKLDYIEGKKKNLDLCEILGYWGDISISPFWTYGFYVDNEEEFKKFYKITNQKYYFYNEKFSEFFVEKMIKKFNEKVKNFDITCKIIVEDNFEKIVKNKIFKKSHYDLFYFSYGFYEENKKFLFLDNNEILKNSDICIETPIFYTPIDTKSRFLLKNKIIEFLKMYKIKNDISHHIFFELK